MMMSNYILVDLDPYLYNNFTVHQNDSDLETAVSNRCLALYSYRIFSHWSDEWFVIKEKPSHTFSVFTTKYIKYSPCIFFLSHYWSIRSDDRWNITACSLHFPWTCIHRQYIIYIHSKWSVIIVLVSNHSPFHKQ
jgi:hypothetical protein